VSFVLLVENLDALGFELSRKIGGEGSLAFESGLSLFTSRANQHPVKQPSVAIWISVLE
jgi:hypothetical protein